jgi:hypothetical protein
MLCPENAEHVRSKTRKEDKYFIITKHAIDYWNSRCRRNLDLVIYFIFILPFPPSLLASKPHRCQTRMQARSANLTPLSSWTLPVPMEAEYGAFVEY